MLTARAGVVDRVRGLDEGADDYLVKPFAFPELVARVRALLRRDIAQPDLVMDVGDLRLDVARHEVWWHGELVALTRKEFGVLEYLLTHQGAVVSAEELLKHVWDENADPFTQTVRVTVGTLRRKLGAGRSPSAAGDRDRTWLPLQGVRVRRPRRPPWMRSCASASRCAGRWRCP